LRQKYTHYKYRTPSETIAGPAKNKPYQKTATAPETASTAYISKEQDIPVVENISSPGIPQQKKTIRNTSLIKQEEESHYPLLSANRPASREQIASVTSQKQSSASFSWPRHHTFTEFEGFVIVFGILLFLLILPLALLTGLVFLIFSITTGLIILCSAAALFLLFLILWIIADI
jgi:hypothetical protein